MTTPREVKRYVAALAALAAVGVTATTSLALAAPWPAWWAWPAALALAGAVFILQRQGFVLPWSAQRTITTIDEPVVMLALVLLPVGWTPVIVALGVLAAQGLGRRSSVKIVFNVSAYTVAACVAALATTTLAPLVPPLAAAGVGVVLYTLGSMLAVSGVFARLEEKSTIAVFRERFAPIVPIHAAVGAPPVIVGAALWALHPLWLLVALPLAFVAYGFARAEARSQREVLVRSRLAEMSTALGLRAEDDEIAERVLDACGDVFLAGAATLTLARAGEKERTWRRGFEGGVSEGEATLAAPLATPDGRPMGMLRVYPSTRARRVQDAGVEGRLLTVVAGQAAAAFASARSLAELLELTRVNESIIGHAPAGMLAVDGAGRIMQLNTHLMRAFGADDDPRGVAVAEWAPLAERPALVEAIRALLAGVPFYDMELAPAFPGAPWLSASGVPLEGDRGAVILIADVSAHKRAEEALREQMLTRPFVRRLVLGIVTRLRAPQAQVSEVGRGLAEELDLATPEAFAAAFRSTGLGNLTFEGREGESYRFSADDLLERQPRATQPTCHLALGYLEGVVAALHGSGALGTEVRCQSQGHEHCRFVVKARPKPLASKAGALRAR